ncbi:hypothetical protein BGW38_006392 [Lunasporangiospora selenospora]|uniref:Uncharacterized protein n=1 Tax=Lunasporangiospora selenospora TaxID=979761 RepID=A0A9P6KH29_9FUNG|nr:hypothetical protein BGW38_006392 [Lunasporangiospora selenospora]
MAFDRCQQGSSEGVPRQLENTEGVNEDIKAAVIFLTLQKQVDPEKIGIDGLLYQGMCSCEWSLYWARTVTEVAKGGTVKYLPVVTPLEEVTAETPYLVQEGGEYYLTPRGSYPASINGSAVDGSMRLIAPERGIGIQAATRRIDQTKRYR